MHVRICNIIRSNSDLPAMKVTFIERQFVIMQATVLVCNGRISLPTHLLCASSTRCTSSFGSLLNLHSGKLNVLYRTRYLANI
mmetsp:Transcript_22374/g.49846  ORF Transcript_22374/g.49846 Transcript_22374/m.49846 type:complete len:83 (+) Transcript_22374:709-957(+)